MLYLKAFKKFIGIVALSLPVAALFVQFMGPEVSAANDAPRERAALYSTFSVVEVCIDRQFHRDIIYTAIGSSGDTSPTEGTGYKKGTASEWFKGADKDKTYLIPSGMVTTRSCEDATKHLLSMSGYGSGTSAYRQFLSDLGFSFDATSKPSEPRWARPNNNLSEVMDRLHSAVAKKAGIDVSNLRTLKPDAQYLLAKAAFESKAIQGDYKPCNPRKIDSPDTSQLALAKDREGGYIIVKEIKDGELVDVVYQHDSSDSKKTSGGYYFSAIDDPNGPADYLRRGYNCKELVQRMNDNIGKYLEWMALNKPDDVASGAADTPAPPAASAEEDGTATSCSVDVVGWVVCPVINFLAGVSDVAYEFLADNFLEVPIEFLNTDSDVFKAWQRFLGISNLILVIGFMFIIFSQLTGAGISNYGVKKLLPRVIVVAILMNISFFICQLAVDLSNILGYSLNDVLSSLVTGSTAGEDSFATGAGVEWLGIATAVLAGTGVGVAAAGGVSLALIALGGVLLAASLTLLFIFFVLIIRQALVVLLIVIAPLAFAAYLLPNTEQWFTRWRKLFVTALLLFPVIGLIFGASTLVSKLLSGVYGDTENLFAQIISGAIMILPLIAVPIILKGALNVLGKFGGQIGALGDKASKGARHRMDNLGYKKHLENESAMRKGTVAAGAYSGRNPFTKLRSNANKKLNNSKVANFVTSGYGAERALMSQAQERKDRKDFVDGFNGDDVFAQGWALSGGDIEEAKKLTNDKGQKLLNETQLEQFARMRNAGHHRKATSFLATAQFLSESGKGSGDAAEVIAALENAKKAGADKTVTDGATANALASFRSNGRGDAMAAVSNHMEGKTGQPDAMTAQQGWAQVGSSSVHREGIKTERDAAGNITSKSEGYKGYEAHLAAKKTNVEQALAGYDSMEARAKNSAQEAILEAANNRAATEAAALGGPAPTNFTSIQQAKEHFGIKK